MGRKSNGRKKVDMVKIQNERNLQVTFSKRQNGLFKKASELCTLSGAEVALVGFSPGNKVYSFGHPSVDLVIDRFLTENSQPNIDVPNHLIEAHRNANVREINMDELIDKVGTLEMERNRGKALQRTWRDATPDERWWKAPIENLNFFQLREVAEAMEMTKKQCEIEAEHQQKVHGIAFPYRTLGSALAPYGGARESSSNGSYARPSEFCG
ncbi:agamous-like MADS-box protein AGL62 [Nicotiana sylvestris]|uniref:Agamous-like MADS-box protein AGL62 n=2 Tax=Nicotiana TaxID=4085 RepID=A0A1S3X9K3_TOBAC|nr:PREDICTED: agamous-like MADS-box protein AGL62 [Nicotiana sylvestris]XP_016436587.1 PREDICTED: agamous-like MADS-box protein AGL62 [Nicotiana tabacum]